MDEPRRQGMTVRQLREALAGLPEEAQDKLVTCAYPSGDYWRTVLCATVERVIEREVRWSAYHRERALLNEERDGDEERDDDERDSDVVVLS